MRVFLVALVSLFSFTGPIVQASPLRIAYTAECKGRGFDLKQYTLKIDGSFDADKTSSVTNLPATSFVVSNDTDAKTVLNLDSKNQRLFRQTEAGISFFGIYDNSFFTGQSQTIYVHLVYNSMGILEMMRQVYFNGVFSPDDLKQQEFAAQFFSEQDDLHTLSLGLKCDFSVKK